MAFHPRCTGLTRRSFLQQSAFHAGSLQTSVPTMLVLEPLIAVLLGAIVLGEHMDVSQLDADKTQLFYKLLGSLKSPCG